MCKAFEIYFRKVPTLAFLLAGNYVCTASNDVGSPQKRVLDLQVGFPPTIELPSPRIPQALYYEVEMECQIHAYPAPAIRWFKGNQSIHNNRQHYIEHFAKRDDFVVSILKVKKSEKNRNKKQNDFNFRFTRRILKILANTPAMRATDTVQLHNIWNCIPRKCPFVLPFVETPI